MNQGEILEVNSKFYGILIYLYILKQTDWKTFYWGFDLYGNFGLELFFGHSRYNRAICSEILSYRQASVYYLWINNGLPSYNYLIKYLSIKTMKIFLDCIRIFQEIIQKKNNDPFELKDFQISVQNLLSSKQIVYVYLCAQIIYASRLWKFLKGRPFLRSANCKLSFSGSECARAEDEIRSG